MVTMRIIPNWYAEQIRNDAGKEVDDVDDFTTLHMLVSTLMELRDALSEGSDYGIETSEVDEMLDNVDTCLALPDVAPIVLELDENWFEGGEEPNEDMDMGTLIPFRPSMSQGVDNDE